MALQEYQSVVREFPTWWLPNLKAAVAARAVHLPGPTVDTWLDRASRMAPTGLYADLVRQVRNAENGEYLDIQDALPAPTQVDGPGNESVIDALDTRWRLVRGARFHQAGRIGAAVTEYRAVLGRDPGCQAARWRLAGLLSGLGRRQEAVALLGEGSARSLHPARWNARILELEGMVGAKE